MTESSLCCAPGCLGDVVELAPVPLCAGHLRETYEFAASLVNARWSIALAEAQTDARVPETAPPATPATSPTMTTDGWVYFIRFGNRIKIGWSSNPAHRFRNLPHDEVLALVPGTMQDERKCHAAFAHLRIQGEWFKNSRDLRDFITGLPASSHVRR